jgi:hypothetical protein
MEKPPIRHLILCAALSACSSSGSEPELAVSEQQLQDPAVILGFESLGSWTTSAGTLTSETNHTEGVKSVGISNISYAELTSAQLATVPNASSKIRLDIQLNALGTSDQIWLYASIPSRQRSKVFIQNKQLNGVPANTWTTLEFEVPASLLADLSASYQDLTFTIALSSPSTQRTCKLDNLRFSKARSGPLNLKGFVGGDDLALTWDADASPVAKYEVLRDGIVVGEVRPTTNASVTRSIFIDSNVEIGRSYSYQVASVDESGERSALSVGLSLTQPAVRFPKPVVTIDDTAAPNARWYFDAGKRALEVWYPKIAQLIAYPDYEPAKELTILAQDCGGGGWADGGNVLKICGKYVSTTPDPNVDTGLFVHEATHIIQNYHANALFALQEGIATWAGDTSLGITRPPTPSGLTYLNGYEYSGAFYAWIEKARNKPSFIRNMNIRAHNAEFEFAWFEEETGETVAQLWKGMTGVELPLPGSLMSNTGLCVATTYNLQAPDTPLILTACGSSDNDQRVIYQSDKRMHVFAHCMGTDATGRVMYRTCDDPSLPRWHYYNRSWINLTTGKCLQPRGSGSNPNELITATCSASSAAQKWNSLP